MEINKIEYEIGIYDLEGHFIDSTDSWEVLEKEFDLIKQNVKMYIIHNSNNIKNFQLRLRNKNIVNSKLPVKIGDILNVHSSGLQKKPVGKYYKDKLICVYNTVTEASDKNFLSAGSIAMSCLNECKGGIFNFKYIE